MAKTRIVVYFLIIIVTSVCGVHSIAEAQEGIAGDNLIYLLKNDDALLGQRKDALDQLLINPTKESREHILALLESKSATEMGRPFRAYLQEALASGKNPRILGLLKQKLGDFYANMRLREIALSILWRAKPKESWLMAKRLVQDWRERDTLRLIALQYLMQREPKESMLKIATRILNNRRESLQMRQAAINLIEKGAEEEVIHKLYQKIITDRSESSRLRQLMIMKSMFLDVPDLERHLLGVYKDSKNEMALRQAALHALIVSRAGQDPLILAEVGRLYYVEKNPTLKNALKALNHQTMNQ